MLGLKLKLLDVGGGFPGNELEGKATFEQVASGEGFLRMLSLIGTNEKRFKLSEKNRFLRTKLFTLRPIISSAYLDGASYKRRSRHAFSA